MSSPVVPKKNLPNKDGMSGVPLLPHINLMNAVFLLRCFPYSIEYAMTHHQLD